MVETPGGMGVSSPRRFLAFFLACTLAGGTLAALAAPSPDAALRKPPVAGTPTPAAAPSAGAAPASAGDGVRWVEFLPPWDDAAPTATDMSFLLDAPAGKRGRVVVCGEHLCFEDGTRARFWGAVVGTFTKWDRFDDETVSKLANRMAKLGFNAVRAFPSGFMVHVRKYPPGSPEYRRAMQRWDKADYFLSKAKEKGIYVYLSLDGLNKAVVPYKQQWAYVYLPFFNEGVKEEFKTATRQLLTHRNPYTQQSYLEDPQIGVVEISNETSLLWAWTHGILDRMIDEFGDMNLQNDWVQWYKERYGRNPERSARYFIREGRESIGQDGAQDFERFLLDKEKAYFLEIRDFLRNLGVKSPIVCGQPFGGWSEQFILAQICDVLDVHAYWDTFSKKHPAVDHPDKNPISWIAYQRFKGKPMTVSEYSHSLVGSYEAEGPLMIATYGRFQDLDGVWFHLYDNDPSPKNPSRLTSAHSIERNPAKLAVYPTAAAIFLRGDVAHSDTVKEIPLTLNEVIDARHSVKFPAIYELLHYLGLPANDALIYRIEVNPVRSFGRVSAKTSGVSSHATAQTKWRYETSGVVPRWGERPYAGILSVHTARTVFVSGFIASRSFQFGAVRFALDNAPNQQPVDRFGVVTLTSLDGEPLGRSKHMLLTAVSRTKLTGTLPITGSERFDGKPWLVPLTGSAFLKTEAKNLEVFALDPSGWRRTKLHALRQSNGWQIRMPGDSPWLELIIP